MFEDALMESGGRIKTKSKYWMIATFGFNGAILATLILIPLLYPEALPKTALVWTAYLESKREAAWRAADVFDMGVHQSPDGVIEYRGSAFGGALDGMLLVCRYSGGDDVVALKLRPDGSVERQYAGIAGMTGLKDPVDLTEDLRTGYLYVSELGAGRITLLRPAATTTTTVARP